MRFNMQPSLEGLEAYLDEREPFDDIHLALFQHGVEAVGVTTPEDWKGMLDRARRTGSTLGADLDEFPRDFAHYARYGRAMRSLPSRYPIPGPLSVAELDAFLADHGPYDGVRIDDLEA
jgi:hypothetical protein